MRPVLLACGLPAPRPAAGRGRTRSGQPLLIVHLQEAASTNDWMLANAGNLPENCWVRADLQTAGRGRRGRAWEPAAGNLYATGLVRHRPTDGPAAQLSLVAAVAVADMVDEALARPLARLKWPNDVLVGDAKVAGILPESGPGGVVVVGVGINAAHAPAIPGRATTALAAYGGETDPGLLATLLRQRFRTRLAQWRTEGLAGIRAAWLARAAHLGCRVAAEQGGVEGIFETLGPDGALLLRLNDGTLHAVHAGDVMAL